MIELDPVEIGQPFHPVVRVLLHHPDFLLDPPDAAERAGAGDVEGLAQVVVVVLERLLPDDAVPAAGDRTHDEGWRPGRGQLELDGVLVGRSDLFDGGEQRAARNVDALGRLGNAVEGGFHIRGSEFGAVGKKHALAQEEGVGLAVFRDLPAMGKVGNDRLAAVAGVMANQVVVHASLTAEIVDRARLVEVEMRRTHGDAVAQHAAGFRVRLRRRQLELRAVIFHRDSRHWLCASAGRMRPQPPPPRFPEGSAAGSSAD